MLSTSNDLVFLCGKENQWTLKMLPPVNALVVEPLLSCGARKWATGTVQAVTLIARRCHLCKPKTPESVIALGIH